MRILEQKKHHTLNEKALSSLSNGILVDGFIKFAFLNYRLKPSSKLLANSKD